MAWTVEFDAEAVEEFKSLDRSVQRRLQDYIRDRISAAEDPRAFGRPLRGDKVGLVAVSHEQLSNDLQH